VESSTFERKGGGGEFTREKGDLGFESGTETPKGEEVDQFG